MDTKYLIDTADFINQNLKEISGKETKIDPKEEKRKKNKTNKNKSIKINKINENLYSKQIEWKNQKEKVNSQKRKEVNVFDGEYMNFEEINQKIGWIENNTINVDENNQEENNEKK